MPKKPIDNPITAEDIQQYLATDQGFQLEMAVYRSCNRNLRTEHGGTYQDPVTQKPRQFDIRATDAHGDKFVRLAIECKGLKPSYPLIVYRLPRTKDESFHEVILSQDTSRLSKCGQSPIRMRSEHTTYRHHEFVGKATAQLGRTDKGELWSDDKEIYDKWAQAIASAHGLVSQSMLAWQECNSCVGYSVVIPVLVVSDGTLWTVDYERNGSLAETAKQVEECEFYLGKEISLNGQQTAYTISHMHIVTKTGLDRFLKWLSTYRENLFQLNAYSHMLAY